MKTLVIIILALGIGFAAAYFVLPKQAAPAVASAPAAAPVAAAPAEKIIVASAKPSAPAEESPSEIIDDLLNVQLGEGSARNTALRLVVYKLEMLSMRGQSAVPAIRAFLGRNVDVDYNQQDVIQQQADAAVAGGNDQTNANGNTRGRGGRFNRGNNGGNNGFFGGFAAGNGRFNAGRARNLENLRTDWVVPPSLRLGLVGVLKDIGGADSEQAMAEMLASTGRGVEVAYLTVMLEEIAPGKYRDAALSAAKQLLMNPPPMDSPDRLDQLAKSYLYGVLEFYNDSSFVVNAQQMLVAPDGRLDQDAMDYLSTVLKEQAVNSLYAAYQNPSLSNNFDKMMLGREIMGYVGENSQANQLFTETLNNPDLPTPMKIGTIVQLAGGGFGPFATEAPDQNTATARLQLLNAIAPTYANDPTMSQAIALVSAALQNGQPVEPQDMRSLFRQGGGFGGRRGGGNRGGN
ncbi:MAG TPA: hypothetical protein VFV23_08170 [Verrucomicrobiae bacterium]|nr:hypothetical protein [Verrucomicrobiae bacterium]